MSSSDYPWSAEAALSRNEAPWKRFSALTPTFHTIDSTFACQLWREHVVSYKRVETSSIS